MFTTIQAVLREAPVRAAWLVATLAFLLFYVPLMLADVPFQDDVIRALLGQLFWDNVGRQAALWGTRILTFSDGVDPYPMTLIEAAAIMGGSVVAASRIARGRVDPTFATAAAAALTSPFLLQNLSYRYDCLSMGIAASCAVVSAALAIARPRGTLAPRAVLLIVLLFSYQAALGLYAGFALAVASDRLLRPDPGIRLGAEARRLAGSFLLPAALSVAYAIAFPFITTGDAGRGEMSLAAWHRNLAHLGHDTAVLLGRGEWLLVAAAAAALVAVAVRRRASPAAAAAIGLAMVAAYVASLGPNLFLRAQPPGVRVMMGFQTPLVIGLLVLARLARSAFAAAACLLFLWNFSFCCRYGNYLATEARATDMVLSHLTYDLGRLRAQQGVTRIEVVDAVPPSPVERTMLAREPALGMVAQVQQMRWFTEMRLAELMDGVAFGQACALAQAASHRPGPTITEQHVDYVIRIYGPDAVVDFGTGSLTSDACS